MGEADYIAKTRDSLGSLIKKPPLTDKLLSKPPFRFLQDVIGAVIKTTKFGTGLYTEAELSETHNEKEAKVAFLQKAIDLVQMVNAEPLRVKPGKIVAGLEADLTNEFLQALAQAARKQPDSSVYVQRVLSGEKLDMSKSDGSATSNKENRERRASGPDKKSSKDTKEKRNSSVDPSDKHSKERSGKEKTKDSVKEEKEKKPKEKTTKEKTSSKDSKLSEEGKPDKKKSSKEKSGELIEDKKEKRAKEKSKTDEGEKKVKKPKEKEKQPDIIPVTNGVDSHDSHDEMLSDQKKMGRKTSQDENSFSTAPTLRLGSKSAKEIRNRPKEVIRDEIDLVTPSQPTIVRQTQSARPGTASQRPTTAAARAAPPKVRRQELVQSIQNGRVDSAKMPTANIIIGDGTGNAIDDDNDNFITESNPLDPLNDDEVNGMAESLELDENEVHGGLVKRILETKKELEENLKGQERSIRPTVVFDAKERDRTRKETAKLQEFIQQLTKTSHPLGKLMDFCQEDIDSMIKEMNEWRSEYKRNETKLQQEQTSIHSNAEPLKTKLAELEQQIKDQSDAIASVKRKILTNEEKISRLILTVSKK